MLPTDTRDKIADALMDLAFENPLRSDFSMTEIAGRAGITRQAIYQKHFRNTKEIVEYLRHMTDARINALFQQYDPCSGQNPFDYFAYNILPVFYQNRRMIRCFYTTSLDPGWHSFIQNIYLDWGLNNFNTKGKLYHLSDRATTKLLVESTNAIIEAWLCQNNPAPAEEFRKDFLRLVKVPIYELLTVKGSL